MKTLIIITLLLAACTPATKANVTDIALGCVSDIVVIGANKAAFKRCMGDIKITQEISDAINARLQQFTQRSIDRIFKVILGEDSLNTASVDVAGQINTTVKEMALFIND